MKEYEKEVKQKQKLPKSMLKVMLPPQLSKCKPNVYKMPNKKFDNNMPTTTKFSPYSIKWTHSVHKSLTWATPHKLLN